MTSCTYCGDDGYVEFRDPDVGEMPCPVCQPDDAYAFAHDLTAMVAAAGGEHPTLKDRIEQLKVTLEVKDEVDALQNRVEEILADLGDRNDGAQLIVDERDRQIVEEGWTPEHDAEHDEGALTAAALAYTQHAALQVHNAPLAASEEFREPPDVWPWGDSWWKPSDYPVRNLAKAGALIAAEIDRLHREGMADPVTPTPEQP